MRNVKSLGVVGGAIDLITAQERRGVNINTDDGARHKITQICKPCSVCVGEFFFFLNCSGEENKVVILGSVEGGRKGEGEKKDLKWTIIIKFQIK